MNNESEMRVCSLVPDLPFEQYKYAEGGRGGGRRKSLGKWPTLWRRAGISFYTSMRLKDKLISVCMKLQASIAQLGHV